MGRKRLIYLILIYIFLDSSAAFFPNNLYQCDRAHFPEKWKTTTEVDYTHESITELAVSNVIRDILASTSPIDVAADVRDGSRVQALQAILKGSQELDQLGYHKAANHFNAEQIEEGNNKLISWRRQIIKLSEQTESSPHVYVAIRYLIGQSLHLMQDFYSNTDWVEFAKNMVSGFYKDLGVEDRKEMLLKSTNRLTCISQPNDQSVGNRGNNVHTSSFVASGYQSGQDIVQPANGVIHGRIKGKCSHGGQYDGSRLEEPLGGINSESFNYFLSPKHFLHRNASLAAILASQAFLYSDIGLSKNISDEKLLHILGVHVMTHVSIVQTASLLELIDISSSNENRGMPWPWNMNHLYNLQGDAVNSTTDLYTGLSAANNMLTSGETLLQAASYIPDNSHLVLVLGSKPILQGTVTEEIIKQVLVQRSIKLLVFVISEAATLDVGRQSKLERMCKTTKGDRFYVGDADEMFSILRLISPNDYTTTYKMQSGSVHVVIPSHQTATVVVNCGSSQSKSPSVISDDGDIQVQYLTSTSYTSIYNVRSLADTAKRLEIQIARTQIGQCTLSTWSRHALVNIYTVTKGVRNQLFPVSVAVGNSTIVVADFDPQYVKDMVPQYVTSSGTMTPFHKCAYDDNRSELRQTYLTDLLTAGNPQDDVIDVSLMLDKHSIVLEEYVSRQDIEIKAVKVIPVNVSSIDIIITNKWTITDLTFSILQETQLPNLNLLPQHHTAKFNESFTVALQSTNFQSYHRPITFVVSGEDLLGRKLQAAHTFHTISDPKPSSEPVRTTSRSNTTTTTATKTATTTDDISSVTTSHIRSTATNKYKWDTTNILLISILGTLLGSVALIVLVATGMLAYHYRCKHTEAEADSKSVLSYRSLPLISEIRDPVTDL